MRFTTRFELHSQTARLVEGATGGRRGRATDGALTLYGALFQGTWARATPDASSADYNSDPATGARFQI